MGNTLSKLNNIVKYDNGYIYTIYHQDNLLYVGSTVNFKRRLTRHKGNCYNLNNEAYNLPIYQYIRSNGDWKDYHFKIIDVYYNITKKLLNKIEGDYIKYFNFDKLLNCKIAGRTGSEYYLDNIDKYVKYREDNKDRMKTIFKKYREDNKDKIKKYREDNKVEIKKYREDNKDKMKKYREDNKAQIKLYNSRTWTCVICNKTIKLNSKSRHLKTPKHINKSNNQ